MIKHLINDFQVIYALTKHHIITARFKNRLTPDQGHSGHLKNKIHQQVKIVN